MTLIPRQRGESQGSVAETTDERKVAKHSTLLKSITFQPVAFETFGHINKTGTYFISNFGRRMQQISGDIHKCLAIAVQRFNSVAFAFIYFLY